MSAAPPLPAVLVTGGATRIGAEIVKGFAAAGWHVVIHHLSSHDEAEALAGALPSAETVSCNLLDEDAGTTMVAKLAARLKAVLERNEIGLIVSNLARPEDIDDVMALRPDLLLGPALGKTRILESA